MTIDHTPPDDILDTVEGEISFFRSIMRFRPIGINRHFHVLAIQHSIWKDTGHFLPAKAIWDKLRSCYDMDALEAIDLEASNYESADNSTPVSIRSPSPSENLSGHPFFRQEFSLPFEDSFQTLISQRRMRSSASLPSSSPAPSPVTPAQKGRKRGKNKIDMAGLVGGDSDSSALTQESGDEIVAGTPKESVVTGTDGGTEYAEEEDVEMREPSPAAPSTSPRPTRGRGKPRKAATGARTRNAASTASRAKKKKR